MSVESAGPSDRSWLMDPILSVGSHDASVTKNKVQEIHQISENDVINSVAPDAA